jgi:hypothetical protein
MEATCVYAISEPVCTLESFQWCGESCFAGVAIYKMWSHDALTVLLIVSQHGPHRKHRSSLAVSNCCLAGGAENAIHLPFDSRSLAKASLQEPISQPPPSDGSTFHDIYILWTKHRVATC